MLQIYLLFLISICTTVGAHLLFKRGVLQMGEIAFSFSKILPLIYQIIQNVWILAGAFLFVISFFTWLLIIARLQLNVAYPVIISLEAILVSLASWFLFKEYLSLLQISGIAAIILGIFLLLTKG